MINLFKKSKGFLTSVFKKNRYNAVIPITTVADLQCRRNIYALRAVKTNQTRGVAVSFCCFHGFDA